MYGGARKLSCIFGSVGSRLAWSVEPVVQKPQRRVSGHELSQFLRSLCEKGHNSLFTNWKYKLNDEMSLSETLFNIYYL